MMKFNKLVSRLLALLLCLPILLMALLSFTAMAGAEGKVIDIENYDGQVILEDPDLLYDIEEDMSEVVTFGETPETNTPTDTPATEAPTDAPTDEPTTPGIVNKTRHPVMGQAGLSVIA